MTDPVYKIGTKWFHKTDTSNIEGPFESETEARSAYESFVSWRNAVATIVQPLPYSPTDNGERN